MTELEFVILHRENLPAVIRYVARRVAPNDVEAIVNEVFSIAWNKRAQCPAGFELPWLLRIASLLIKNQQRKSKSQPVFLELNTELGSNRVDSSRVDSTDPSGLDGLGQSELSERLVSSWNRLSRADREVLALVAFEELDARSLAKALGTSINAATIRLSRARKKLESHMKEFKAD
jgi:RNA polymerase sigma factor (sigma-70 family)